MDRYYQLLKKHYIDGKFVCRYCGFKRIRHGVYALTEERHHYRLPHILGVRQGQAVKSFRGYRLAVYRRYHLQDGYHLLGCHFVCRNCQASRTRKPSSNRQRRLIGQYGRLACVQCNFTSNNPSVFEEHHVNGHHVGPTVLLCLNCHAIETERQRQGILNSTR